MQHSRVLTLALFLAACSGPPATDGTIPPLDDGTDTDTGDGPTGDTDTDPTDTSETTPPPQGLCAPLPTVEGTLVGAGDNLTAAVANASGGDVLILEPGTYTISNTITIDKPLTIRSQTNEPSDVVIDGNYSATNIFLVTASSVTIAHVTLTESRVDAVRVTPAENGAATNGFRMHDVVVLNSGAYGVVMDGSSGDTWPGVDDGEISCSTFELQDSARNSLNAICDAGAIDASGVLNWVVRDNRAINFWCPGTSFPHAMRFHRGSREVEITRNVLIDTPLGIVVGQGQDNEGRTHNSPCPPGAGIPQMISAVVTNNIVSSNDAPAMLAGIRAESSCNAQIIHNSIFGALEETVAYETSSIDHSFERSSGVIANNMTSHAIRRFANSEIELDGNVENVPSTYWFFPGQDDFHTAPGAVEAINQGSTKYRGIVPRDIDDEVRDDMPDVGADERL